MGSLLAAQIETEIVGRPSATYWGRPSSSPKKDRKKERQVVSPGAEPAASSMYHLLFLLSPQEKGAESPQGCLNLELSLARIQDHPLDDTNCILIQPQDHLTVGG